MQYYINTIFALKSLNLFLPRLFIFPETSARLDSVDFRRVTTDLNPGRLWGHGGALPGDFMKAAVRIPEILLSVRKSANILYLYYDTIKPY